eukprot:jgi/Ulvmu1/11377/UM075_0039.1
MTQYKPASDVSACVQLAHLRVEIRTLERRTRFAMKTGTMEVSRKIMKLYSCMESMEASLGGGGGFEGFYGSVTANGVSRVYDSMTDHCRFGRDSFLVDIGGGVGRPLVHALVQPGLKTAVGIELDEIKCLKSESVIRESLTVARELADEEDCVEPRVIHRDIEKVNATGTLDPATHAYAFWEGIPVRARVAFGELFAKSSTLQCVAVVQRAIRRQSPAELMAGYNFGALELVETLKGIHMSGSNRSFTAYVFKRLDPPGDPFTGPPGAALSSLLTAPRLLQTSLPRLLRRRKPNPAHASTTAAPVAAPSKPKRQPRGRVALVDTMPQLQTAVNADAGAADHLPATDTLPQLQQGGSKQCAIPNATSNAMSDAHEVTEPQEAEATKAAARQDSSAQAGAAAVKPAIPPPTVTQPGRGRRAKATPAMSGVHSMSSPDVLPANNRTPCSEVSCTDAAAAARPQVQDGRVSGTKSASACLATVDVHAPESFPSALGCGCKGDENQTPSVTRSRAKGNAELADAAGVCDSACGLGLGSSQLSPAKRGTAAQPPLASPPKRSCGKSE